MSDELLNSTRELLALRDRFDANPDDGRVSERFADAVPRAFDTLRELQAEVERLKRVLSTTTALAIHLDSDRAGLSARTEAAEQRESVLSDAHVEIHGHRFACSQAVADHVARLDADRVAAEARLRELAEAPAVVWWNGDSSGLDLMAVRYADYQIALIRRPEMPS